MAAEETVAKASGWLKKAFMMAVKTVTVGLVVAVAWQMFLDPLFFPIIHDPTNIVAQAWMMKINNLFGWIPQHAGLAKQPGLLSAPMKSFLSKEMGVLQMPASNTIMNAVPGGLSLDAVMP